MPMLRSFFCYVRKWKGSKDWKVCDVCHALCDNTVDTARYSIPIFHCETCVQKMTHELLECNRILKQACHARKMAVVYNHTNCEWEVHCFIDGTDTLVLSTKEKSKAEIYLDYIENQKGKIDG